MSNRFAYLRLKCLFLKKNLKDEDTSLLIDENKPLFLFVDFV